MTTTTNDEIVKLEAERAALVAENEAAIGWGAAVGARSGRIKAIDRRLSVLRRQPTTTERAAMLAKRLREFRVWSSRRSQYDVIPIIADAADFLKSLATQPAPVIERKLTAEEGRLLKQSAVNSSALAYDITPAPGVGMPGREDDLTLDPSRVAEVIADGDGFWRSCSGCYETEDGQNVHGYPHSPIFDCIVGNGCGECGGIGAVWDTTNYADMAEAMMAADKDALRAATPSSGQTNVCDDCNGDGIERYSQLWPGTARCRWCEGTGVNPSGESSPAVMPGSGGGEASWIAGRDAALEAIQAVRHAGACNFTDKRYAGQRGVDHGDALYDAYQAVRNLAPPSPQPHGGAGGDAQPVACRWRHVNDPSSTWHYQETAIGQHNEYIVVQPLYTAPSSQPHGGGDDR